MRQYLPLLSLLFLPAAISQAQTKPEKSVPLESRSEAHALVQQLLREGKIMAPSDAKRGMKGYALSVFQGTTIEKFGIEVLGVLEKVQGGGDLVLIKVTSGPVVSRQSGIIQGMSGSPVYINGKLLGAIAIGFGFPKEPIGGVTPITQMIATGLPENKAPAPTPVQMALAPQSEMYHPKEALSIGGRRIAQLEVTRDRSLSDFDGPASAVTMRMRPATQMLELSGVSPSSMGRWKAMLEPYGLTPVMGGGAMGSSRQVFGPASKKSGVKASLAPGAAIGVQLASGDIDATGIGTVTYRIGNRLLAFGHPMFGLGAVSMPMTTAYIHDLFPAYDVSFKLGSAIEAVGELQQDTNFAIGGTVGRHAQTVPLRISIHDGAKKIDKQFNIRLIKDALFTPQMAQSSAVEAMQATVGLDSDKMVRIAFSMGLKNGPAIHRVNTVYAADQVASASLSEMMDALSITQANPYEKGNITSMDLHIDVIQGRKTAQIRRIYADRNRAKAGEKVQVSVELEPTGQPDSTITRRFTVQVPDDAPNGYMRIAASSGTDIFSARARVGGAPPNPGNFRELLDAYAQIGADNELLIQTSTPRRFLMVDRKKVSNPPPSWARLVPGGPSSSIGTYNETQEQRESSEWVLSGMQSVTIPVESARSSDRQRPDSVTNSGEETAAPTLMASSDAPDVADSADSDETDVPGDDDDDIFVSRLPKAEELDAAPNFNLRAAPLLRYLRVDAPAIVPSTSKKTKEKTPVTAAKTDAAPATTPTPTPTPSTEASATNIARPAGRWIQKTSADFSRGKFDGTLVESDGTIRVGPKNDRVVSSAEPIAWSIAADSKGAVYLGTGNNARILKIEDGVSKVLYEGKEVAVSALALDKAGTLYAGVSPGGRVLRFRPDGSNDVIFQTGQTFVNALAFDGAGNLIVATGGESAAIYRIQNPATATPVIPVTTSGRQRTKIGIGLVFDNDLTPYEGPKPLAVLPQKHARSLAVVGNNIYVGTSEDAILYRIDATNGDISALYQATGDLTPATGGSSAPPAPTNTTQTIVMGQGAPNPNTTIIMGGSGIMPGASAYGQVGNEILALAASGDDVYFGTSNSGSVFHWNAKLGVQELYKTAGRAVYSLLLVGKDLYAGTGENGEVWRISNLNGDVSAARVLDASQPQVLALATDGIEVLAATGNNAAVYEIGGAGTNTFTSNVFDASQVVRFGTLRALATGANFEFRSGNTLEPDSTWTDWKVVQNGDNLGVDAARYAQYRVKLGESGTVSRVEVAFRAPNHAPRVVWTSPAGAEYFSGKKTLSWTGSDPDKDPLHYKLELIGADDKAQAVDLTTATASSQEVDTKKFADGVYRARITASDAARNPEDPQNDITTSLPFTIDNTAPALQTPVITKNGATWQLTFSGNDALSPLAGAEWRLAAGPAKDAKPGDWQAAASKDGLFDSKLESGVATLDPAMAGVAFKSGDTIEVRLRDAAGNSTTTKVVLP